MPGRPNDNEPFNKTLPCRLTDSEVLAKGEQLAAARLKIEALKDERKALNERITTQQDKVLELAELIDARVEEREVKCLWVEDFTHKVKKLIRQDTAEEVESCTMSAADLQDEMDYGPEGDDEPGGDDDVTEEDLGELDDDDDSEPLGDDAAEDDEAEDAPMREHLDPEPDDDHLSA